jgi:hypothetical protein
MSRKKPTGGRVTPKGTQPATTHTKRSGNDRPGFPAHGGTDPVASKARTPGGPVVPTRSGHHRGNR